MQIMHPPSAVLPDQMALITKQKAMDKTLSIAFTYKISKEK